MITLLLLCLPSAFASQQAKVNACTRLMQGSFRDSQSDIEQIFENTVLEQEKVANKIIADMLVNCYKHIDLDSVAEILSNDYEADPKHLHLVSFDKSQFIGKSDIELTEEQRMIFSEIMSFYNRDAQSSTEPPNSEQVTPDYLNLFLTFGWFYIGVVAILFGGLMYLGFAMIKKEEPKSGKRKRKDN